MQERERIVAGALLTVLCISWLGFVFHRSPRFAGSLVGGMLGVAGALCMLVPLMYLFVKRIPSLRRLVTRHAAMSTLLTWHIYLGVLGPILAILHTGHRFASILGITLTTIMLVVVFSGFIGRYLLSFVSDTIQDKTTSLHFLEQRYRLLADQLASRPEVRDAMKPYSSFLGRLFGSVLLRQSSPAMSLPTQMLSLSEAIADLEYSVRTHQILKRVFSVWLRFHIALSLLLYGLLAGHIVGEVYYGLRWFD